MLVGVHNAADIWFVGLFFVRTHPQKASFLLRRFPVWPSTTRQTCCLELCCPVLMDTPFPWKCSARHELHWAQQYDCVLGAYRPRVLTNSALSLPNWGPDTASSQKEVVAFPTDCLTFLRSSPGKTSYATSAFAFFLTHPFPCLETLWTILSLRSGHWRYMLLLDTVPASTPAYWCEKSFYLKQPDP